MHLQMLRRGGLRGACLQRDHAELYLVRQPGMVYIGSAECYGSQHRTMDAGGGELDVPDDHNMFDFGWSEGSLDEAAEHLFIESGR
jgi:hypothetical protein